MIMDDGQKDICRDTIHSNISYVPWNDWRN